ncbi:MAG: NuoM family protein [Bradymonadia bacterium]
MEIQLTQQAAASGAPWLSIITWLPLLGALMLMGVPKEHDKIHKGLALAWSGLVFLVSLAIFPAFNNEIAGFQLIENKPWIEALGIRYALGIDGISFWLVILTTFLTPLIILGCWNSVEKRVKEFMICFLVLETAMLGALLAIDLFFFYLFWEMMLIPMYLLIGVWGGKDRIHATIKFFIYTAVGSLLMLVAIFYLYAQQPADQAPSFMLENFYGLKLSLKEQLYMFGAFGLAFAIKVPLFPFHTWLPRAHVQAPTAGSVILAGVLLKMGTYGFVRFAMPMFPDAVKIFTPYIAGFAVIGIIYGAFLAYAQSDVKRLVAYSSVSHLGFVMLGLMAASEQAVEGAVMQMLNHGISTGALFLLVGMIYERRHTREISEFGGISKAMPIFAIFLMIVTLSSVALPGTNGFVGEFLIFAGTFSADGLWDLRWYVAIGALGVIFGALYMLYMFQQVMFGPLDNPKNKVLKDLNAREIIVMVPLIALIFIMGVAPNYFLKPMHASVDRFLTLSQATTMPADDAEGRARIQKLVVRKAKRDQERKESEQKAKDTRTAGVAR